MKLILSTGSQVIPYEATLALYVFCTDYHDGQDSRKYRLSCKLLKRLQRAGYCNMMLTSHLFAQVRQTPTYKCFETAVVGN